MNAERLHAIAQALHEEMNASGIVGKMEKLSTALEMVANPQRATQVFGHPNVQAVQQQLAENLETVYSSLSNARSDDFSPAWRQQLQEMGGDQLFGASLKRVIEDIFQRNQITLTIANDELKQLQQRLETFQKSLDAILSAFKNFNIGNEQLEPGECEIGMLIPRVAVKNELMEFSDELKELSFVLNTFSEVATGKPDELFIKTISSTDLTVYLVACVPFAACLAHAIERIVGIYKQMLEIRKLRTEMLKQGVPEKQMAGIEAHANNLMAEGIETLCLEIVDKFYHGDKHRKNELIIQTRISLNKIANRIDRGYNIEVRVEPLKEIPQDNEPAKETAEKIQAIQAASKNMQFMKLEGKPILQLPESVEKTKSKEVAKSESSATESSPPAPVAEASRRTRGTGSQP